MSNADNRSRMLSVLVGLKNRLDGVKEGWMSVADKLGDCYQTAYRQNHQAFVDAEIREKAEVEFMVNALTVISLGSLSVGSSVAKTSLAGRYKGDSSADFKRIELFAEGLEDAVQVAVDKTLGSGVMPALKARTENQYGKRVYKVSLKPNNGTYKTDLKNYIRDEYRAAVEFIEGTRALINGRPLSTFRGKSEHEDFEKSLNWYLENGPNKNDAGHTGRLLLKRTDYRNWDWAGMQTAMAQAQMVVYALRSSSHMAPPPEVVKRMKDIRLLAKFGIKPYEGRSLLLQKIYLLPVDGSASPGIPTWGQTQRKFGAWAPPKEFQKLALLLPPAGQLQSNKK